MKVLQRLTGHKTTVYLIAFVLMIITPLGMYLFARAGNSGAIWCLVGVVALGNLVVILAR